MQKFFKRYLGIGALDAKNVALLGIFTALSFVFTMFATVRVGNWLEISLKFIPIFVMGALFGPVYAGIVCFLSDVISVIFFPVGAPIIGMFLTEFLSGFTYGILFYRRCKMNVSFILRMILCVLIQLVLSLFLNSYFLYSAGYFSSMSVAVAVRFPASFSKLIAQAVVISFSPYYLKRIARFAK